MEEALVEASGVSDGAIVVGVAWTVSGETEVVAEESLVGFGMGLVGSAVLLRGLVSIGCCDPGLEVSITAARESCAFPGG